MGKASSPPPPHPPGPAGHQRPIHGRAAFSDTMRSFRTENGSSDIRIRLPALVRSQPRNLVSLATVSASAARPGRLQDRESKEAERARSD